jgi:hypothetical protein
MPPIKLSEAETAAAKNAAAEKVVADKAAAAEKTGKRETFGKVHVLAESKTHRVLQDDRFAWKEAK